MAQTTMVFAKLKLVALQAETKNLTISKRERLTAQIGVQISAAKALTETGVFTVKRQKAVQDAETGETKLVEKVGRFKQWWWTGANGKVNLAIWYGKKQIELAKGKNCIELASIDELIGTLEAVKAAVIAGELDDAIAQASAQQREVFMKKKAGTV